MRGYLGAGTNASSNWTERAGTGKSAESNGFGITHAASAGADHSGGATAVTPEAVRELARLLSAVHPGKRIRPATLLREPAVPAEVATLLRAPDTLACLVRTVDQLAWIACLLKPSSGTPDGAPIILRRRFSSRERTRAVLDLNNIFWTLETETALLVPEELRRYGVAKMTGVGDANLPFLVAPEVLERLHRACDALILAPAGTPADGIILTEAQRREAMIVSNDMFRSWRKSSPWRRRNIHRLRVPIVPAGDRRCGVSFGDPGAELASPPVVAPGKPRREEGKSLSL